MLVESIPLFITSSWALSRVGWGVVTLRSSRMDGNYLSMSWFSTAFSKLPNTFCLWKMVLRNTREVSNQTMSPLLARKLRMSLNIKSSSFFPFNPIALMAFHLKGAWSRTCCSIWSHCNVFESISCVSVVAKLNAPVTGLIKNISHFWWEKAITYCSSSEKTKGIRLIQQNQRNCHFEAAQRGIF